MLKKLRDLNENENEKSICKNVGDSTEFKKGTGGGISFYTLNIQDPFLTFLLPFLSNFSEKLPGDNSSRRH
jgi:hypothetical protein